jgi:hypothetical protein
MPIPPQWRKAPRALSPKANQKTPITTMALCSSTSRRAQTPKRDNNNNNNILRMQNSVLPKHLRRSLTVPLPAFIACLPKSAITSAYRFFKCGGPVLLAIDLNYSPAQNNQLQLNPYMMSSSTTTRRRSCRNQSQRRKSTIVMIEKIKLDVASSKTLSGVNHP